MSGDDFGELVLLLGDIHVPTRHPAIPKAFEELLNTNKIGHVLCTGNLGSQEVLDRIRKFAPNVHVVSGDMDYEFNFPEYIIVKIGNLSIGLIHGHQIIPDKSTNSLLYWQRKLSCDILIYGSTHRLLAEKIHGKVFLNPGSITGAYCPTTSGPPSFMLMSIQPSMATVYCYELTKQGTVNVTLSHVLDQSNEES